MQGPGCGGGVVVVSDGPSPLARSASAGVSTVLLEVPVSSALYLSGEALVVPLSHAADAAAAALGPLTLEVVGLGGASARDQNKFLPPSSSQSKRRGASSTLFLFALLLDLGLVDFSSFSLFSSLSGVSCDWRSPSPFSASSSGSVGLLTGQEKAFFIRLR